MKDSSLTAVGVGNGVLVGPTVGVGNGVLVGTISVITAVGIGVKDGVGTTVSVAVGNAVGDESSRAGGDPALERVDRELPISRLPE